jgi:hypothetical protein
MTHILSLRRRLRQGAIHPETDATSQDTPSAIATTLTVRHTTETAITAIAIHITNLHETTGAQDIHSAAPELRIATPQEQRRISRSSRIMARQRRASPQRRNSHYPPGRIDGREIARRETVALMQEEVIEAVVLARVRRIRVIYSRGVPEKPRRNNSQA